MESTERTKGIVRKEKIERLPSCPIPTVEDSNQNFRKEMLDSLLAITKEMSQEFSYNKDICETNPKITTEILKMIDELESDPLGSVTKAFFMQERALLSMLDQQVQEYLKSHKRFIFSAYKSFEFDPLHYCIVLKKDSLDNRSIFNNFLTNYLDSPLSAKFPIAFQFVPTDLEKGLKCSKKLVF